MALHIDSDAASAMHAMTNLPLELREIIYFWIFRNDREPTTQSMPSRSQISSCATGPVSISASPVYSRGPSGVRITLDTVANARFEESASFLHTCPRLVRSDMHEYLKSTYLVTNRLKDALDGRSCRVPQDNFKMFRRLLVQDFPHVSPSLPAFVSNLPLLSEVTFSIYYGSLNDALITTNSVQFSNMQLTAKQRVVKDLLSVLKQKTSVLVLRISIWDIDGVSFKGSKGLKRLQDCKRDLQLLKEFILGGRGNDYLDQLRVEIEPNFQLSQEELAKW